MASRYDSFPVVEGCTGHHLIRLGKTDTYLDGQDLVDTAPACQPV